MEDSFFSKKGTREGCFLFLAATNSPKNRRYRQSGTFSTYDESPTHDDEKKISCKDRPDDLKFWRALEALIGASHFKANHVLSVLKQLYLAQYWSKTLEK